VTTFDDGPHGCTANAWAEEPDPPVLLVTLRRTGETLRRISSSRRFAVNLLGAGQDELARRFAARDTNRFAEVSHEPGQLGQPLLSDALACLECEVQDVHAFGAYDIVVGSVRAVRTQPGGTPLIFVDGDFRLAR
jgi:flavin reductase (DIM6/NTAB) family NADH-FMN oxidoreductase RutF